MTKIDRSKLGKCNRQKGHNLERQLVKMLRPFFPEAATTRATDRSKDNDKIDVFVPPFNFQCKSLYNFKNPVPVLAEMPKDSNYNVLCTKIKSKGIYFTLEEKDFMEILKILKINGII